MGMRFRMHGCGPRHSGFPEGLFAMGFGPGAGRGRERGGWEFDWGGGGTYKEKYGVEPHLVPWFYKSKYPLFTTLRDEARSLFYRSQTLVGRLRGVRLAAPAPPV